MSFRLLAGFSALVMSMMCGQSVAAEKKEYTSHIGITGEYHDLHFVEIRDGEPVNEEKGSLLFNGGIFHWQWASGLLTEVSFKQAEDTLAYNGYTQLGRFVTTTTEYYISDFSFVLGRSFGATSAYLGVNMHYRERNILGVPDMNVSGLYEELDTTNGVLGFRAALFRHNPLQLRLEARIATGVDSSLYFNDGDLDPATITPGRQNSYRIAAEILYNPFSRIVVSLIPAYEYTRIDKSSAYMTYIDGSPTGHTSFLPQTEWESYSITGKLSWYF